jgi:uncharacterized circularly permuted ATP-grasp superfamily protein/uncharacterized alpha-E superfamily protein
MIHAYAARRTSGRPERRQWDEMVGFHGRVRRGWRDLSAVAEELGPLGLAAASAEAARLLVEDGVTYRPPTALEEQTWALDPLPVFIEEGEWAGLELGLAQRTLLLDRLLADLYSQRRTIRSGMIPAELIYGHPGFLRAWDRVVPPSGRQLFLAATDLARDGEGAWCVVADRVQAPSGAGYVMANRRVVSRVLPTLHQQAEIHRLGPFFHAMRLGLEHVAPATAEGPRIVLLTPGMYSETAYEQAFLSVLLGHPLVRGSDLVATDGRVWQKTLGRLEPVDVILRRVDSWYCDPLDLRPDSELGVAGLIEAARNGSVTVVNSLGSGVLENPALLPFLPAVCQDLLDEPLRLRSAPTWWCGHRESRSLVLSRLTELVLKPIARGFGRKTALGWELSASALAELRARVETEPWAWVGQEPIACSTAPSILGDGLHPREMVLRTFSVATAAGFQVMTGGLAQVGVRQSRPGGGPDTPITKDVWIRNTRGAPTVQPWVREATPSQMVPITLSPRVLENMFWLGRYAERAEDTARLLRAVLDRWGDFHGSPEPAGAPALTTLLGTLTTLTATWPGFTGPDAAKRALAPSGELGSLILDDRRPGTLAHAVRRLTEVAGEVREQLSTDTWLVLGSLEHELAGLGDPPAPGAPPRGPDTATPTAIGKVMEGLLALSGLIAESLVRDAGWRFLELGRRIERACGVAALLRGALGAATDPATESLVLESVLIATESIITYRRRYAARAGVATALDLIVVDRENPRAIAYQLDRIGEALGRLPAEDEHSAALRERVAALRELLRGLDTAAVAATDESGTRVALQELAEAITVGLFDLSDAIESDFFVRTAPQRSLSAHTSTNGWTFA